MALLSQLSGCTLVRVDEDVLILRLSTAQATATGAPVHRDRKGASHYKLWTTIFCLQPSCAVECSAV